MVKLSYINIVVLGIGLIAFTVAFVVQFRLRHHVSPDRVRELLHTPSKLYPNCLPPKAVLNERGRQLHRLMVAGGVLFAGGIAVTMLLTQVLSR